MIGSPTTMTKKNPYHLFQPMREFKKRYAWSLVTQCKHALNSMVNCLHTLEGVDSWHLPWGGLKAQKNILLHEALYFEEMLSPKQGSSTLTTQCQGGSHIVIKKNKKNLLVEPNVKHIDFQQHGKTFMKIYTQFGPHGVLKWTSTYLDIRKS